MNIEIKPNDQLEGYDLIDANSDQSHDGDNAREVIATVYNRSNAAAIATLLNVTTGTTQNVTIVTELEKHAGNPVWDALARWMRQQQP